MLVLLIYLGYFSRRLLLNLLGLERLLRIISSLLVSLHLHLNLHLLSLEFLLLNLNLFNLRILFKVDILLELLLLGYLNSGGLLNLLSLCCHGDSLWEVINCYRLSWLDDLLPLSLLLLLNLNLLLLYLKHLGVLFVHILITTLYRSLKYWNLKPWLWSRQTLLHLVC